MGLSIGIVGLPNVGKSTLFNLLTQNQVEASNYPFCTIDPHVGCVKVPDERLAKLAAIANSEKIIPTMIEFVDIAGLVKGAHAGEGLGNQFLANIREVDAICHVVRHFEDSNVIHVDGQVNPKSDREVIDLELIMADLQSIDKRLASIQKNAKSNPKEFAAEQELLGKIKEVLEAGKFANTIEFTEDDKVYTKQLNLLTVKPVMFVVNTHEPESLDLNTLLPNVSENHIIPLNVKMEAEIMELPEEERGEYLAELGLNESGLDQMIRHAYGLLNLITYFTVGPKETHAWTITKGTKGPGAAGVIHTDFEKGFIRAEVIHYPDYVECEGESGARDKGKLQVEGKDYELVDGDICHFLFNK